MENERGVWLMLDLDICKYCCNLYEPDTNACSGDEYTCPQMGPSYLCGECPPWLSDADPAEYVDSYCKSRECPLVMNEFEKPF